MYGRRANIRLDGHVYTRTFDRWSGVCLSIRILRMCSRHGIGLPEPMPWLLSLDLCPAFTWCLCSFGGVDFVSLSLWFEMSLFGGCACFQLSRPRMRISGEECLRRPRRGNHIGRSLYTDCYKRESEVTGIISGVEELPSRQDFKVIVPASPSYTIEHE